MKRGRRKARVRNRRVLFRGPVFRVVQEVVEEPGGRGPVRRDTVEHGGSVVIMPVLPDGRVLLVRQYRHAVGRFLWELAAGHIGPGESPRAAARRELAEETGYRARRLQRLGEFYPTPGFVSEKMILYRATGLRPGRARPESDESIRLRAFGRAELRWRLRRGRLRDAKTLVGLLLDFLQD